MYESLREWACFPIKIHSKAGMDASGDPIPGDISSVEGYRVDNVVNIVDTDGIDYVSMTQIYFPPEIEVSLDAMIELDDGLKYKIRKLSGFYDGVEKALSIRVVYL